jgi:hypothetical protein
VPWALGFFTYSSIKEHFTSIVGLEGNRSDNRQSFQLRNNGFWVWRRLATANPSKISLSQFWTMSTFHMARALLTETMFSWHGVWNVKWLDIELRMPLGQIYTHASTLHDINKQKLVPAFVLDDLTILILCFWNQIWSQNSKNRKIHCPQPFLRFH